MNVFVSLWRSTLNRQGTRTLTHTPSALGQNTTQWTQYFYSFLKWFRHYHTNTLWHRTSYSWSKRHYGMVAAIRLHSFCFHISSPFHHCMLFVLESWSVYAICDSLWHMTQRKFSISGEFYYYKVYLSFIPIFRSIFHSVCPIEITSFFSCYQILSSWRHWPSFFLSLHFIHGSAETDFLVAA